jgi:hypothetical protein
MDNNALLQRQKRLSRARQKKTTHNKNRKLKKTWYKQVLTGQGQRDREE